MQLPAAATWLLRQAKDEHKCIGTHMILFASPRDSEAGRNRYGQIGVIQQVLTINAYKMYLCLARASHQKAIYHAVLLPVTCAW